MFGGYQTRAVYDWHVRWWWHLDLGAGRLFIEAEIRRLRCPRCDRVVTEEVPFARRGARLTRDLEDLVAYLAQQRDKTTGARLLRISWATVARTVVRVAADHLDARRLDGLFRIGVDGVSYRKGHRYLTVVADHDRDGAVEWAGENRSAATLSRFFAELGPERCARLEAISVDMSGGYAKAIDAAAEAGWITARVAIDPFHVVRLANQAIDACRRWAWNEARRQGTDARWVKNSSLLSIPQAPSGPGRYLISSRPGMALRARGQDKEVPSMSTSRLRLVAVLILGALAVPAGASAQSYQGQTGTLRVSDRTPAPGASVGVAGSGFAARSKVIISIESAPLQLAVTTADDAGAISTTVSIPTDIALGTHTLKATGITPDGATLVLSATLEVAGSKSGLASTGGVPPALFVVLGVFLVLGAGAFVLAKAKGPRVAGRLQ